MSTKNLLVLLVAFGLMSVGAPTVSAQTSPPSQNVTPALGTCADVGLLVVEPTSVSWQSDSDPVFNPRYQWAYGDVDLLWDNSVDEYWFHWYDAVPGADPYVVYRFDAGTTISGVQFTNDWSSGDLQLLGLDGDGQPAAGLHVVPLDDPFESHVASLNAMTVASIQMTTSTQQVKLLEVDFCGGGDPEPELDLVVSALPCEVITATWTAQPGADHRVTVVNSTNTEVDSQSGLVDSYGPVEVVDGDYTITLEATSAAGMISETATTTVDECGPPTCDPADAYCDSMNVLDSFGDSPVPADSGMQWNAVTEYYNTFGSRSGMCSIDVHNSYWTAVRSADGGLTHYPSWHPPVHDPGGPQECRFTHEHGIDPRTSNLYDEDQPTNIGVPFGFVHSSSGNPAVDREDHVGHKVVVWNDFQLTSSNPYHGPDFTLQLYEPEGVPITCDWYSKLHQGTHSSDALGFNLHEYYLNYSCDDGTEVRIKELTSFGFPDVDKYGNPVPIDSPEFSLDGGSGATSGCDGWFRTNLPGPAADPDPSDDSDFGDAGRGFTCFMNNGKIEELWKPSATLRAPDGAGSVDYDPYYVVMNSNRYAINEWWEFLDQDDDHVGENAMISMVDFCVEGSELRNELSRSESPPNFVKQGDIYPGQFRIHTYCESVDDSVLAQWEQDIVDAGGDTQALMDDRKFSIDNPFVGTRRGVHTKGPVVYGRDPNFGSLAFFCSDHLGNDSTWPINPDTAIAVTVANPWSPGEPTPVCSSGMSQIVSTFFNKHYAVEGSNAGADPGNQSNGPGSEITIDIDALYPNHGVQAPN